MGWGGWHPNERKFGFLARRESVANIQGAFQAFRDFFLKFFFQGWHKLVKTKWLIIITFMSPMQRFVGVYESRRRGKKKKGWYLAQKHLGEKKNGPPRAGLN